MHLAWNFLGVIIFFLPASMFVKPWIVGDVSDLPMVSTCHSLRIKGLYAHTYIYTIIDFPVPYPSSISSFVSSVLNIDTDRWQVRITFDSFANTKHSSNWICIMELDWTWKNWVAFIRVRSFIFGGGAMCEIEFSPRANQLWPKQWLSYESVSGIDKQLIELFQKLHMDVHLSCWRTQSCSTSHFHEIANKLNQSWY